MLFQGILDFLLWLFGVILEALDVPEWVVAVGNGTIVAQFVAYMINGAKIMAAYTHYQYWLTLLGFVILIDTFFMAYKVIMWILRKLPFVHIS